MSIQNSTNDNTYIMHTKIKEFIDVHFRRFDEINIEINQNSVSTFIDFHLVEPPSFLRKHRTICHMHKQNPSLQSSLYTYHVSATQVYTS